MGVRPLHFAIVASVSFELLLFDVESTQPSRSQSGEGDVAKPGQTDAGLAAAVAGNTYTTRRRRLIAVLPGRKWNA